MIFTHHQILLGLSNQEDEMGRICGWYERGERCIQGFGGEPGGKRHRWDDNIKLDIKEM